MSFVEVDKAGLASVLARRGVEFVIYELLQNAFDEDGVTKVTVIIEDLGRGWAAVQVEDDSPFGFRDLSHAYTLFAESYKKGTAVKRGRYNMGDKLVVALCRRATITTTSGRVVWEGNERHRDSRSKTERGSVFVGELKADREGQAKMHEAVRTVFCPEHIELMLNGEPVPNRKPVKVVSDVNLPTEIGEELRRTRRNTTLTLYPVEPGGVARIYEMGIPVVEIECAWSIDVGQKVPLNMDRDNVTPSFLREARAKALNAMHEELPPEHAAAPWVSEALGSKEIEDDAVRAIVVARHGDKAVIADPSDREAEGLSSMRGFQVIHGGSYSGAQWDRIKAAAALLPAGQVNPSPKPFHIGGEPLKTLPRSEWNVAHECLASYAQALARDLLQSSVEVTLANDREWRFGGAYRRGHLTISIVGRSHWFSNGLHSFRDHIVEIDRLLIHEYAHHNVSNHLSEEFHEECCKLGARLAAALRAGKLS